MRAHVALGEAEARAVREGKWVRVDLGRWIEVGPALLRTKSALVGLGRDRKVVAWANVCLHQPLGLDLLSEPFEVGAGVRGAPMDDGRIHLLCHSHGALYRTTDGYCVSGPSSGQSLIPLDVEDAGAGAIRVVFDEDD